MPKPHEQIRAVPRIHVRGPRFNVSPGRVHHLDRIEFIFEALIEPESYIRWRGGEHLERPWLGANQPGVGERLGGGQGDAEEEQSAQGADQPLRILWPSQSRQHLLRLFHFEDPGPILFPAGDEPQAGAGHQRFEDRCRERKTLGVEREFDPLAGLKLLGVDPEYPLQVGDDTGAARGGANDDALH